LIFKGGDTGGELNGFLDAGSHIQGDLHFEDTFRMDGRITGRVISKGDLIVGEPGVVNGDIEVARVVISGRVTGTIRAVQRIEIAADARVSATVITPVLVVEKGAYFDGKSNMDRAELPRVTTRRFSDESAPGPQLAEKPDS